MATEMLENKMYGCEAATVEILDRWVQDVYSGHLGGIELRACVEADSPKNIDWKRLRHIRIIGDDDREHLDDFEQYGLSRGFYLNADGTWLLLILPEKPHLGEYFSRCSGNAESLWICNSQMYSRDVGKLPGLKTLYFLDNPLIDSIERLDKLTELNELSISNCPRLIDLSGLGKLTTLTELEITGCNNLTALPGLEKLTGLTRLCLSGCPNLNSLPRLEKLTGLTNLSIIWCGGIVTLPGLENLTRLTQLRLFGCRSLTALPGLEKLTGLTELDLSGCSGLTALPGLENLTQLTTLNLDHCSSLTNLPSLENLTQLTTLNLDYCSSLTELPRLNNLPQLETLLLRDCTSIKRLTEDLRHLDNLKRLKLCGMDLLDLPDWLPEIADSFSADDEAPLIGNQTAVWLNDTTVDTIPDMSIFDQPHEMIVDFFRKRKLGDIHPLNEIKVVFLGDGEAGKSHTIARLMNDGGDPDTEIFDGQSTPGIVIRNKEYDLDGRKIQVHYWDFGGQEIMHSMHRIFLTGRTMYVILLNARDDTQSDRAKYWLHNVKSFAPDAPVLLVLNKIDQNPQAAVDERTLRARYSGLTQVLRLSALNYSQEEFNRSFTNVLLDEIKKSGYLNVQWPKSWTEVKKQLENMTTHYITGEDYRKICETCKVDDNQKNLLHWFNDLGVSFCCCDEDDYALEDYVILRPDWITNALYIILFNKCAGARNGLIPLRSIYKLLRNAHSNSDIRCTLPQARYNNNDIQYVLGIMRKFQLSFSKDADYEFIPMLAERNANPIALKYEQDADILEFRMEFEYLPDNLLHKLMVERHDELVMKNVWRTGATFELEETGLGAVVVIEGNVLKFFIRHTDPQHRPNTYLAILKTNVDRLVKRMGLKPPKCFVIYKQSKDSESFDYEELKLSLQLGQTNAVSHVWKRLIPIEEILRQSAPTELNSERALLDAIKRSCQTMQDEPMYRLIANTNGNGYANGQGMEDMRNRRVRDDLGKEGYKVLDQTQRGSSGTGTSIGELDMLVLNENNEPWTIIEALRVSNGTKADWNKHLDKLIGKYNTRGFPFLYLLTYVDADPTAFARIWKGYQGHIQKHNPGHFAYSEGSFVDLNDANSPQYVKTAKCKYDCEGQSTTVYHIFARIPMQNE